jgi:hypothetical protein
VWRVASLIHVHRPHLLVEGFRISRLHRNLGCMDAVCKSEYSAAIANQADSVYTIN